MGFDDAAAERFWVTQAGTAGPAAVRSRTRFRRDLRHARSLAERAFRIDGSLWIGDWHTHPAGFPYPSTVDLTGFRKILAATEMNAFLSLILSPSDTGWENPVAQAWRVTADACDGLPVLDLFDDGMILARASDPDIAQP